VLSILVGALNGYALSFWRPAARQRAVHVAAGRAFVPYQV
jgi:glucose/mannose transport system permease protein